MARSRLSAGERDEIWRRYRSGETLKSISVSLALSRERVRFLVADAGGISPPVRRRSVRVLSVAEREVISRGLAAGWSVRSIATSLGRSPSTVSREVSRNGGRQEYRAVTADAAAWHRARRPKACKLAQHGWLRRQVAARLRQGWTPEQIAGWLARRCPNDETRRVSHETIYLSLYVQARGVLRRELLATLKSHRVARRPRSATRKHGGSGQIPDMLPISARPPEAADRAVPGHWEGDLIEGAVNSAVATLVERRSRFIMLAKVDSKRTADVVPAVARKISGLPASLRSTVTWDRGKEMSRHVDFTVATGVKVYFADPASPWQRPTNENSNRLIREYLPKGTDLSVYSQRQLDAIARKLNARPRKVLDYATPASTLIDVLH